MAFVAGTSLRRAERRFRQQTFDRTSPEKEGMSLLLDK